MGTYSKEELLELQETLYDSSNPTRRWLHRTRRDWILSRINGLGQGAARVLEVGPGSGVYLPALSQVAQSVTAADIEDAYLEQANVLAEELANLQCLADDITQTQMEKASFDLILCTEVIEHIADSPAALAGLASLLTEDGVLILSTPQRFSPLEVCARIAFLPGIIQVVRWIYREPIIETGHINLLTESALAAQLSDAGLATREAWKSGFYLPLVAELLGSPGQRFLAWCEDKLRDGPLSFLLWTQYRVLGKRQS